MVTGEVVGAIGMTEPGETYNQCVPVPFCKMTIIYIKNIYFKWSTC